MATTELLVDRILENIQAEATLGRFYWGSQALYATVEDLQRSVKIWGKTAIPTGRYKAELAYSPHFGRDMPHLRGVPNYEGVLIHWGNTSADTDGCIIIGLDPTAVGVANSKAAFSNFMPRFNAALLEGEVWITVRNSITGAKCLQPSKPLGPSSPAASGTSSSSPSSPAPQQAGI